MTTKIPHVLAAGVPGGMLPLLLSGLTQHSAGGFDAVFAIAVGEEGMAKVR